MPIRNLDKIFAPKHVAVIGGSNKAGSLGRTVLENLTESAFQGSVYPVNLKHKKVGERPCFKAIADLPEAVDLAVICTPAMTVPGIVRECGQAGILGLVILSAGFREADKDGKQLELVVRRETEAFDGMRIVGPNCLGVMAPHAKLNATLAYTHMTVSRVNCHKLLRGR